MLGSILSCIKYCVSIGLLFYCVKSILNVIFVAAHLHRHAHIYLLGKSCTTSFCGESCAMVPSSSTISIDKLSWRSPGKFYLKTYFKVAMSMHVVCIGFYDHYYKLGFLSWWVSFLFQIRKAFRNIRRTVPDILHVMVLFFASIAILALMAVKILQQKWVQIS